MPTMRRQMALTADLVARVARVVEDLGPSPGAVYRTDVDHEATIRSVLASAAGCSSVVGCWENSPLATRP